MAPREVETFHFCGCTGSKQICEQLPVHYYARNKTSNPLDEGIGNTKV
jgi:hypothetical protein